MENGKPFICSVFCFINIRPIICVLVQARNYMVKISFRHVYIC